jgi:hypothetical protein
MGNTAVSYCRNREDIKELLVNPALHSLMLLARGFFTKEEELRACEVLQSQSSVPGCLSSSDVLNIVGPDGSSVLMKAILHSNFPVTQTLMNLRVDYSIRNNRGITCALLAHWIGNPRIKRLFQPSSEDQITLNRLKELSTGINAQILFLGNCLTTRIEITDSMLCQRMQFNAEFDRGGELYVQENFVTNAKYQTFSVMASSDLCPLNASEVYSIALYANSSNVHSQMNGAIQNFLETKQIGFLMKQSIETLMSALMKIDPFVTNVQLTDEGKLHTVENECYIGCKEVDRAQFAPGSEVTFPCFLSAVSQWRIATENIPDFTSKKREGVIFILRSNTGRFISQFAEHSFDCEVVFTPFSRFKVLNWYHGDVFALGQANIREHTFKVRSEKDGPVVGKSKDSFDKLEQMMLSNRSLIIELEELPRKEQLVITNN